MANVRTREMRGQYPAALHAVQRAPLHQRQTSRKGGILGGIRSLT